MALFGLYIDPAGSAHLVPDPPANPPVPPDFLNELKNHKACPCALGASFNGLSDAAAEKKINDGISGWGADDKANRAAITKAEKDNDPTEALKAARTQEEKDLGAEDTANKNNLKGISGNPNLNPAEKTAATTAENERHKKARGVIIAKRAADEKAAHDKQKAAVDAAKDAAKKPASLDVECKKTDACIKCQFTQMGILEYEVNGKKTTKFTFSPIEAPNYSHLSPNHLYFCICG